MELFTSLASFVLSVVIIYYVVRKATDAEEQTKLLRQLLNEYTDNRSANSVVTIIEKAKSGGQFDVATVRHKTEAEYLAEARAKHGE